MFERFASLTRFSHGWTVTEKIDGTNACVLIEPIDSTNEQHAGNAVAVVSGTAVWAQSRNRLITPESDNAGFARYVLENVEDIVSKLGDGRHYGEWCGKGIQRGYGLPGKLFALFNTARWADAPLPPQMVVAPVLGEGYMGEPGSQFEDIMANLKAKGSRFAPGFMNPEGIVMRHGPSGTLFKKTFDYDEQGKWAEKQARS